MSGLEKANPAYIYKRIKYEMQKKKNAKMALKAKEILTNKDFSIISQNCVGGVLYHDLGLKFTSPTINLYFEPLDFMRYILNLRKYNDCVPKIYMDEKRGYPVGKLD